MSWIVQSKYRGKRYTAASVDAAPHVTFNPAAQKLFDEKGIDPFAPYDGAEVANAYANVRTWFPGVQHQTGKAPITWKEPLWSDAVQQDDSLSTRDQVEKVLMQIDLETKRLPEFKARGEHTGAMVALIPDAESAAKLHVAGGDPIEELHLTLYFLMEDAREHLLESDDDLLAAVIAQMLAVQGVGPIDAMINGSGLLGDTKAPATVYLVGDSAPLAYLLDEVQKSVQRAWVFIEMLKTPRLPHIAHVTAGWGINPSTLTYRGPVRFDRVRIAIGGRAAEWHLDMPKIAQDVGFDVTTPEGKSYHVDMAVSDEQIGELELKFLHNRVTNAIAVEDVKDVGSNPSSNPHATRLRIYWTRGPGAAKIKWGVPGDFKRAVKHLRKFVGARAEGLAAVYHHVALGVWPGRE